LKDAGSTRLKNTPGVSHYWNGPPPFGLGYFGWQEGSCNRQKTLIGMEASGGSHFLGRALRTQGHDARLIRAQFVKPFRKSKKDDYLGAEAIDEAVS
jgi:transposase